MSVRLEVSGLPEVLETMARLGKAGRDEGKKVLKEKCEKILGRARPLTPVGPEAGGGALRDSGRVTRPTVTAAGRVSCGVVFGGAPLEATLAAGHHHENVYAIRQHEDLTLKHTVGGPKFLERPAFAVAPEVPDAMLAALEKVKP